jgi:uncharacterized membrane protein YdjX (TVP38/TMEM64 family)
MPADLRDQCSARRGAACDGVVAIADSARMQLERAPEGSASAARAVRALSLAPLVAIAVAYAASPWLRATLNRGVDLLAHQRLDELRLWARDLGAWAAIFTALLMIVQALAAPIPAVLVTWTNSWLFGPFVGAWWSIATATFAACVCFQLARVLGAPVVSRFVAREKLDRADGFLARHGAVAVLIARLLPFVPFDPISYVAGLSSMRMRTFAWTTFVGQVPAGLAYSYLGQEIASPARFALLGACTLLALIAFGWSVARILRARSTH